MTGFFFINYTLHVKFKKLDCKSLRKIENVKVQKPRMSIKDVINDTINVS